MHVRIRIRKIIPQGVSGQMRQIHDFQRHIFLFCRYAQLHLTAWTKRQNFLAPISTASSSLILPISAAIGGVFNQSKNAAAAMAFLAVMLHFHKLQIGNRLDYIARRLIDTGCPADMTGVMPGYFYRLNIVGGKTNSPDFDFFGNNFGVVFGLDIVINAQFLGPLGINIAPHHVAGRTGGNHGIRSGMF